MGTPGATGLGTSLDLTTSAPTSDPERPGVASLVLESIRPTEPPRPATTSTTAAGPARDEIVVPVSLPRGATREIVLRIVLTSEGE
jgi:hypothetical protein